MNFTASPTQPSSGLNMDQLNDLLGSFKSDIMGGIDERFSSFQAPTAPAMPDYSNQFSGLEQRLAGLETQLGSIQMPAYEPADYSGQFGGLEDKIAGIEQQLSSLPTPAGVDYNKISSLVSDQVNQAVSGIQIPTYQAPDLSGIEQQISGLNERFNNLPGTDYGQIQGMVDNAISGINIPTYEAPDLSALTGRLDALDDRFSNFQAPAVDLNPITSQIEDLKTQFGNLQPQQVDLSGLTGQIGGLQSQLDGFMNDDRFRGDSFATMDPSVLDGLKSDFNSSLGGINDRLDQLDQQFGGFNGMLDIRNSGIQDMINPALDPIATDISNLNSQFGGINDRFSQLDQRLDALANQPDLTTQILDSVTGDGQFEWNGQQFDLNSLIGAQTPTAPGDAILDDYRNNWLPGMPVLPDPEANRGPGTPGYNPAPAPAPNPTPAPVPDDIDWNRYGRDYGEVSFGVGGTAGNQPAASTFQPGQGGVNLQDLLANLGL